MRSSKRVSNQLLQLESLRRISSAISRSLELKQILSSSVDNITEMMDVDAALIFLPSQEIGHLALRAHRGVTKSFVDSVGDIKLKEDIRQPVTEAGLSGIVEDRSNNVNLPKIAFENEGLQSLVLVPLKANRKATGALCVATHNRRRFNQNDIDLLCNLGNQIGIAIENAILYDVERKKVAKLRLSEKRYRALFQNAHDAIWVHDMDGNIISANVAAARLTGYSVEELCRMNVKSFLSEGSLRLAKEVRNRLLDRRAVSQPYEQRLITKNRVEAILKLTTDVVEVDGKAVGFQHIARDITEEKHMQESLRFYLGQITLAQEEERKRIARELHDETIQSLVVLARQLDDIISVSGDLPFDKRRLLDNLRKQADDIMANVRRLSQDLRPPTLDRLGLLPALEWLASDLSRRSKINIEVTMRGVSRRFSPEVELCLFRIAQESLMNTLRHSRATNAEVAVEFSEELIRITIRDDGKGFCIPETTGDLVKQGRLGLAGMQERVQLIGGKLKMNSGPDKGTIVTIEAPAT